MTAVAASVVLLTVIIPALSVDEAIVVAASVALSAVVVASVALGAVVVTTGAAIVGLGRRICANSWVSTYRLAIWRLRAITHILFVR